MGASECLSAQVLGGYAAGTLSVMDAETIDAHLNACGRCVARLDEVASRPEPLVDALRGVGESLSQPPELAAAVAAVLAGNKVRASKVEAPSTADTVIGGYRIVGELGRGGMGRVYRAAHPRLDQEVALKVLRPGMDSAPILARFEAERQALALMEHPHIARVSDGGVTENGQPFFVMELVRGVPITRYCEEHGLGLRRRLELFIDVCQAVQHAHQKGVIHRDLKPSNILVAEYDARATPKIIDFGVARAIERRGDAETEIGMLVGTPEYMSPEQASLSSRDMDTRSDIYALGVILYELLTGDTPIARHRVRALPVLELLRLIREEDPPAPSMRASQLPSDRIPQPAIHKSRWKELDWITLKALDKDRGRRYETASALADDVRRFLTDELVLACPPSNTYRLRKLVRRHKGPALASALILLALLGGVAGTTVGLVLANRERWIAETERDKTREALTAETRARKQTMATLNGLTDDVVRLLGQQVTLAKQDRVFLDKIVADYAAFAALPGQDEETRAIRAEGHLRVGFVHGKLGESAQALSSYGLAREQYRSLVADFPANLDHRLQLLITHNKMGDRLREMGRHSEAEAEFRQAQDLCAKGIADLPTNPAHRRELSVSHLNMGVMFTSLGKFGEAAIEYRQALALRHDLAAELPDQPEYRRELAQTHHALASALKGLGKLREAEDEYRHSLALREQLVADFPTIPRFRGDLALGRNDLAILVANEGNLAQAEEEYRHALAAQKHLAAEFPSVSGYRTALAKTHNNLGNLLRKMKKPQEGETELRASLALLKQLAGDLPLATEHAIDLGGGYCNFGNLLREDGKPAESLDWYQLAIETLAPVVEQEPRLVDARRFLHNSHHARALSLMKLERFDEAMKDWNRAEEVDDGKNRIAIRVQRAACLARIDPLQAVAEADEILKGDTITTTMFYTVATVFALSSAHSKDTAESTKYAIQAVVMLHRLHERGYFAAPARAELLKNDPDLNALRMRPGFLKLLSALESAAPEERKQLEQAKNQQPQHQGQPNPNRDP